MLALLLELCDAECAIVGLPLASAVSFRFDPDRETEPMTSALSSFALRAMTAINTSDFIRYESCSRKVEAEIKVIEYRDVEYKTESRHVNFRFYLLLIYLVMMIDIHKFNGISNNSVKDYIWVYADSVNAL